MKDYKLIKFGGTFAVMMAVSLVLANIIHIAILDRAQAPATD